MKRITILLFFISFVVFAFGQYANQHNMRYEAPKRISENVVKYPGQHYTDIKALGDIIYEEHFSGAMPAGWGVDNNIAWNWVWTDTGPAGVTPGADEELVSTTAGNGWMMYDSDGGPSGAYDAKLISPSWDFSTNSSVMVSFEEFFRKWDDPGPDKVFLDVSNDSTNWTSYEFHAEYFGKDQTPNPTTTVVNISSIAANQSQVWIRFRTTGDWDYNWQIDDLIFAEASDNDLRIWDISPCFMYTNGGYMYMNPYNQPYRVFFGAKVLNFGNYNASNVTLDVDVTGVKSGQVYTSSYDTTIIEAAVDNVPDSIGTGTADATNYWAYDSLEIDTFTITYTVTSDSVDEDTASTVATFNYITSDTVYARDFGDLNTRWTISPQRWQSGGTDGDVFGVQYYLNQTGNREMSSISFYVHATSDTGATVRGQLYYNDGTSTDWTLMLETDFYVITEKDTWVTLPFLTDGFSEFMPAGDVIAAIEFVSYNGADVEIAEERTVTHGLYECMYKFAGDDWSAITNYMKVPYIRLNEAYDYAPSGVKEASNIDRNIIIYPNPTTGTLSIGNASNAKVEVFNMLGAQVAVFENVNNPINISDLSDGNYIVKVTTDRKVATRQISLIR